MGCKERMERIDAMPAEIRGLVHEYGLPPIDLLLSEGIDDPPTMRLILTRWTKRVELKKFLT